MNYWLSRVLVTSEMDSKGLPASGFESVWQPDPSLIPTTPPRDDALDSTRRCCCCCWWLWSSWWWWWRCCCCWCPFPWVWICSCPCLSPSLHPFPLLMVTCCNQKYIYHQKKVQYLSIFFFISILIRFLNLFSCFMSTK